MDTQTILYLVAALLMLVGIAGTVLPALPGIPLVFAGMVVAAWAGDFQYVGWGWLVALGILTVLSLGIDLLAGSMGAKRVGASKLALAGAVLGSIGGLFFGPLGLFAGPFVGALVGDDRVGTPVVAATHRADAFVLTKPAEAVPEPELAEALSASAARALGLFAGAESINAPALRPASTSGEPSPAIRGGLQAVSAFLESNVPEAERERASDVLVRILNGTLFELIQISRERAGLPPLQLGDATQQFMSQAVISLSDTFFYPAPMTFQLTDFTHVQASVFQVARAPGQNIVYLGCLLLIVGVFAMLYVRERRLWVWLAPAGEQDSQATMALSSNRKTMESDQEFDVLKSQLLKVNP